MEAIDPVELLRRQYLQCLDPDSLTLPKPELLRLPETQSKIYSSMFDGTRLVYAPPERYRFRVLKRVVAALEEAIEDPDEDEISDDISGCMGLYMAHPLPSASVAAQQKSYVTYTAPTLDSDPPFVVLSEARSLLASSGTTGFRTWEAALHLACFLFSPEGRGFVINQSVLELGAGTGFLSIFCAAHLGAKHVLATDGSGEVINDLKDNLDLNRLKPSERIDVKSLQWGHALLGGVADCREDGKGYDLVVGTDVTYDIHSMPALVATLRDLFELYPKTKVLISATVRNEDTLAAFLRVCDANAFTTKAFRYDVQDASHQIGFFHPTSAPLRIYLITNAGQVKDPFGL